MWLTLGLYMEKYIYLLWGYSYRSVHAGEKVHHNWSQQKERGGGRDYIVSSKPLLYGRVAKCVGEIESALGTKILHGTMGLASTLSVYIIVIIIFIILELKCTMCNCTLGV